MNASLDEPIRVVILDSHALVRAGLRLIVDSHPSMKVVGEAGEANEELEIVSRQKPDIILLKLDPIGSIGLEIMQELFKTSSSSRIILLARIDEVQVYFRAVQEGVLGIVLKTQSPEILIKAI
jgi:two-component system response regulator NreC